MPIKEQSTPAAQVLSAPHQQSTCATADEALMRQADKTRGDYYQIVRRDIALAAGEWAA